MGVAVARGLPTREAAVLVPSRASDVVVIVVIDSRVSTAAAEGDGFECRIYDVVFDINASTVVIDGGVPRNSRLRDRIVVDARTVVF